MSRLIRAPRFSHRSGPLLAAIGIAVGVAACGSGAHKEGAAEKPPAASTSPPTTITQAAPTSPSSPPDPLPADRALVRSLYYAESQASDGSVADEAAFTAAHNYPEFRYTVGECAATFRSLGFTNAYKLSQVPDVMAMAPDPGWTLPANAGRYAGMKPVGRVYILPVQSVETDSGTGLNVTSTHQYHVSILNGAAYFFEGCEKK